MPKYRRGSGSVYKRGKTWWLKYYVDGKAIYESSGVTDRAEAGRILREKMGEVATGRHAGPAAERVTFDDLAEMVLNDYSVNGKKSLPDTEARIRLHLRPFFGGKKKAQKITSANVQAFVAHRKEQGASNAEVNRELAALKRMFNLAMQVESLTRKPHFPRLEEDNARQGFFEPWQFEAILVRLPEHLRPPITWAYYTGWRMYGEILPLVWDRVDIEAGSVRLYRGTTKNKDGRVIVLPQVLKNILEQQWQQHIGSYPECPFVFHDKGREMKSFYKAWRAACQAAGLSGKLGHDFRRTAVRNLVRAGVPERVAMMITGHRTRDVFDRYNIVSVGDLEEAAARKVDERIAVKMVTMGATATTQPR